MFKENPQFFQQHISKKTAELISADHTFKVAANIGCILPNGSWSMQFDSLFIIMNEIDQILTYKLTKGTAISKVDLINRKRPVTLFLWMTADECTIMSNLEHLTQKWN